MFFLDPRNALIDCDKLFAHKELDFKIKFTPQWSESLSSTIMSSSSYRTTSDTFNDTKHNDNTETILKMYWPADFNYKYDDDVSGTATDFETWAQGESYLTKKEIAFGLDMRSNALFRPSCDHQRKFLAHRYAFCFYLFDDLYEYLMSFDGGRQFGDTFAHNFRAIVSGQEKELKSLDEFQSKLPNELRKAKLVQQTTIKLMNEAKQILSLRSLNRWYQINYITYTTCQLESELWRQKVALNQFISKREYADVKRFNSAFHSVLFILLDESDLEYYPTDEPLTAVASIAMCLDNDIFSFPKERQLQVNPFNTIRKFVSNGHTEFEAIRKLLRVRNEMVRSLEVTSSFLPVAQQRSLSKCFHFLGGLLNYHSTCIRFGWTHE